MNAQSASVVQITPLDGILSVVLMIGLLWSGIVLFNKKGPLKIVGGFLLLILSVNLLNTSNFWVQGFDWAFKKEEQFFKGLEAWK